MQTVVFAGTFIQPKNLMYATGIQILNTLFNDQIPKRQMTVVLFVAAFVLMQHMFP